MKDNYLNLLIYSSHKTSKSCLLITCLLANVDRFKKYYKLKVCPVFKKSIWLKYRLLQHKDHGMVGYITKKFLTLLKHLFHGSFHKKTSWVLIIFFKLGSSFIKEFKQSSILSLILTTQFVNIQKWPDGYFLVTFLHHTHHDMLFFINV